MRAYKIDLTPNPPEGFSTLAQFVASLPLPLRLANTPRTPLRSHRAADIVEAYPILRTLYREIEFAVSIARDYLADPSVQTRIAARRSAISLECGRMDLLDALVERANTLVLADSALRGEDALFS